MAAQDPQSRRWSLTINNPKDCGLDHDTIIERLHLFHPRYFCLADEIGESGTYHTHIYLFSHSPIRFSTVKNRFPPAHIEKSMKGSVANRDYITKSGKWADTKKAGTSVEGTFFEFGDIPTEAEEDSPSMYALMGCVEQGMTNAEIIRQKPSYAFRIKGIDEMRDTLQAERYMHENRAVQVFTSMVTAEPERRAAFSHPISRRTSAALPIMAARTAQNSMPTTDSPCWCLKNFTVRSQLPPCSIIWTFTPCSSRPDTTTVQPAIPPSTSLPISLWTNSIRKFSALSWRRGGHSCGVSAA